MCNLILFAGVYFITGTKHFQTPETGIAFTQIITAISTLSGGDDNQNVGFVRTHGSGTVGQVLNKYITS